MSRAQGCFAIIVAMATILAGCVKGDYATVTISYQLPPQQDAWHLTPSSRQKILKSFWKIADANGYKCHAHVKRVEEIACSGPREMNITFQPALNRPQFTAKFNWVELNDGRTHDEFTHHIQSFARSMTRTVNDESVHLAVTIS